MFQLIARHLLHTLNIIVVESFTTPHHYCPMSVQPLPALTVTDKLISFKLSDIFYAIFSEYYKRTNDIRALKMAQYFKYGTDNENEIWMLRYGLSFEDIEILKPYIVSIGQEEIVFSADIQNLSPEQIKSVERYL